MTDDISRARSRREAADEQTDEAVDSASGAELPVLTEADVYEDVGDTDVGDSDVGDGDVGDGDVGDGDVGDGDVGDGDVGDGDVNGGSLGDPAAASGPEVPEFPAEPGARDLERLWRMLLGLLFATEGPLPISRLAHACAARAPVVRQGLELLRQRIEELGLPFVVLEAEGVFRLVTGPDLGANLLRLRAIKRAERLSPAALETLAVIAYRQPVMRAEVEAIRGVKAGPILRTLLDRKLIRVAGRADVPGRPVLYGTTKEFLDRFALQSPEDLPSMGELRRGQV